MNWLWEGARYALIMTWETCWALVLGFLVSAALQVFVSKERMGRLFGRTNARSILLATGLGAASSSCSYAAAAGAKSAFKQGAALVPALAFMFASTNLVIELGAVLWLLLGWRFVLAEVVGAFVLIALVWALSKLLFPRGLEDEARRRVTEADQDHDDCHHRADPADDSCGHYPTHAAAPPDAPDPARRWRALADAFVMDWQMLWKEIVVGFLIAGYLMALVPADAWQALFLRGGPGWLRVIESSLVGPLIAVASFVCSVGNVPLASVLWSGGISFGGVISFIYADLLIIPLIFIYRKYYGGRTAAYLTAVFYLAMSGSGIVVDLLFTALGLVPDGPRPPSMVKHMHVTWNYTTWFDLAALVVAAVLGWRHLAGKTAGAGEGGGAHCEHHGH